MEILKEDERRKGGRPAITDTMKDEVVRMYKNNMPISMIVSTCKISKSSVYKILKERTQVLYAYEYEQEQ